jgi:hypothetical protein
VKPFSLLKIPVLLVGFGALLIFAPACKAQSEVNPDHFDGADPWETAARKPVAAKTGAAQVTYQAQNKKTGSGANLQLAAVRETPVPVNHNAAVVRDKRKQAVRQPEPK